MLAKRINIGRRDFSTQEALKHFQQILHKYNPGERITGEDEVDVAEAFHMNPRAAEKLDGHQISHFEVAEQPERYKKSRSFVLVRSDGHRDDFSFFTRRSASSANASRSDQLNPVKET